MERAIGSCVFGGLGHGNDREDGKANVRARGDTVCRPHVPDAVLSVTSVTASFPAMHSRARNGESSASACENFRFHGQTSWAMCRYNRCEIALEAGRRTLGRPGDERSDVARSRVDFRRRLFKIHEA